MDALREAARRDPLGPAVEGPSAASGHAVAWSWADLDRAADMAALRLGEAGIGAGDAVGAVLPPSPEMLALLFALPRAGALLVPLDARSLVDELRRRLEGAGRIRLVLAPAGRIAELRRALPHQGVVEVEEVVHLPGPEDAVGPVSYEHLPVDPTLRRVIPDLEPDTPVAVILTSGSTGRPRPVVLTHGNLAASARGIAQRLGLDPMDRWLSSLSPAHVGGLALLHRAVSVGSVVVTRERFRTEEFLDLARRGEITHASLVPVMLQALLEASSGEGAPRSLRCLLLGGARTPLPLLDEALRRRWPVALTYGLTEASSQVATATPAEVRAHPGCVGRPIPGVRIRIATHPGAEVRPGPEGAPESQVRPGPEVRLGLVGAAGSRDSTGEILVRGGTVTPLAPSHGPGERGTVWMDREGWLHTGDLGRLDDEGGLWVVGRASERIISGGVTVEPAEVEEVLLEHPAVAEAVVVGLPDKTWGERIVAVVAPGPEGAWPDPERLRSFAGDRLDPGRRPREVMVVKALPRNPNGKVDLFVVRNLFADQPR
ncbi:MAG: hypothetical protein EA422_11230 [Gemmatimonadales bacterium]|nr:MAG: hypothetical protein EA422_11230 [Gemmatimonadales bacterium]